ncbi:MAG: dienelactone hydrolase family protein [Leptolyngbya sp.]|nr:dienelactone hydrolase family protein [Candidatus Melainabacteria bacterium]
METAKSIVTEWITFEGPTYKIPVYTAQPGHEKKLPALILIHEIFGVSEHIKELATRFAKQGLRVFAPELFAASPAFPKDPAKKEDLDTMREVWSSIPDTVLIDDLKAILLQIQKSPNIIPDAVGTIGYCMGGAIAFMFAASAQEISFAIDYYGRIKYPQLTEAKPTHPLDFSSSLKCPLLSIFAGQDELITPAHIELLKAKLEAAEADFEVKVFENAPHAFFNDTREHYQPQAASQAWNITLNFIEEHTRIPVAEHK